MPFRLSPQLSVRNLERSAAFYTAYLDFVVVLRDPPEDPVFVLLEREGVRLFLVRDAVEPTGGRGSGVRLYMEVADVHALCTRLRDAGAEILRPITYNEKEGYYRFVCRDPEGYELGFYAPE